MKGLRAPRHRHPQVPKAEIPSLSPEVGSQVSKGIGSGACRATLGTLAIGRQIKPEQHTPRTSLTQVLLAHDSRSLQ